MAEDPISQLTNYKLQYQQVEAALTNDPDNEELLKLKHDLEEVINLTKDLIAAQIPEVAASASSLSDLTAPVIHTDWKVGDRCSAMYAEDKQYYNALIEEVLENGTCTVTFEEYGNTDITQVALLKQHNDSKRSAEGGEHSGTKNRKDLMVAEREYKKKKAQKKKMRMQQLVQEKEEEKNKWVNFNAKTFSKTNKGKVKKSIFATPDSDTGKVGIGTCGVSGKGLTKFGKRQKWNK